MSAPTAEFAQEFAARFAGARNACDPGAVLDLMHPEILCHDSGWPTLMRGHDQVDRCYRYGRLTRLSGIFDAADLARQLGILPAAGSRTEATVARPQRVRARFTKAGPS